MGDVGARSAAAAPSVICLCLTAPTLEANLQLACRYAPLVDLFELRVDRLDPQVHQQHPEAIARFPTELAQRLDSAAPLILTVRRTLDGGSFEAKEPARRQLIEQLLLKNRDIGGARFAYIDLELDLLQHDDTLSPLAREQHIHIIRSFHDLKGGADKAATTLAELATHSDEIPKLTITPHSVADLVALLKAARSSPRAQDSRQIIVGMGGWGFPTRVLIPQFRSLFGYCSPTPAAMNAAIAATADAATKTAPTSTTAPVPATAPIPAAAPGQLDPEQLHRYWRHPEIAADWSIFAVIGNPIMHSRSPHWHNSHFAADRLPAVLVPVLCDDIDAFFQLAELLPFRGFSVTVPHKQTVMRRLDGMEQSVRAIGACNTVVRQNDRWEGFNSDIDGFLAPLAELLPRIGRATVIGAGGAARAAIYALHRAGVAVCLLNRTEARARAVAAELEGAETGAADSPTHQSAAAKLAAPAADQAAASLAAAATSTPTVALPPIVVGATDTTGAQRATGYSDLIVQATSLGMAPSSVDAFPAYRFVGHEIVYDLVYTPPQTPFIRRARAAGCTTIAGDRMFNEQAARQYQRYSRTARNGH